MEFDGLTDSFGERKNRLPSGRNAKPRKQTYAMHKPAECPQTLPTDRAYISDVFLTARLRTVLATDQLNAQNIVL